MSHCKTLVRALAPVGLRALVAVGGSILLLAAPIVAQPLNQVIPDQTVLVYRGSGGLAGVDEQLVVTRDGQAWAYRAFGPNMLSARQFLPAATVANLGAAFREVAAAGYLAIDDCKRAPVNSVVYLVSGWADGNFTTRQSCTPQGPLLALVTDAQLLLNAVLARRPVSAKVLEISFEIMGLDPIQPITRGLTVYQDGSVVTWIRTSQGAVQVRSLDRVVEIDRLLAAVENALRRLDLRRSGAPGDASPPGAGSGGQIQVRLFDTRTGGTVMVLKPEDGVCDEFIAQILDDTVTNLCW